MIGRPSRIFIGFLLVSFLLPVFILAADDPVARADELYRQRKDRAKVLAAVEILTEALEKEPGDYKALWRLARCYWFLGDRSAGKERLAYFEKGKACAEKATKANGAGIDGHYWHAALIGCVGQERGILNSLFMVPSMRRELERCLELDPRHAEAHDVMAQLLWKVPGFAGGNLKKALEEARLATVYGPESIEHWLHYGQIAAAIKDYATARMAFQKALSLPDDPEDPEGSRRDKALAKEELEKIR